MASTNKTENLNLSQFLASDKPGWLTDYNNDMEKIDNGIAGIVPIGSIMPFAAASAPSGWLLCEGQAVSRTEFSDLFQTIGTVYGTGDGSTTFNVPNLRGRFLAGSDASTALGSNGGKKSVTANDLPQHRHSIPALSGTAASAGAHTHTIGLNFGSVGGSNGLVHGVANNSDGSLGSHILNSGAHTHSVTTTANNTGYIGSASSMDILPPFLAVTYIIKT